MPRETKRRRNTFDQPTKQGIRVRGMFRIQLVEDGRIVGDSGWAQNLVVNEGFDDYLTRLLSAQASSKQISRMMLGTGVNPAVTDTALPGELNTATYTRTTVTVSVVASSAVEFQATWASANSHITASTALQNIGIINDTTSGGSMFAGRSYTASTWNTNQNVNASYRITFA